MSWCSPCFRVLTSHRAAPGHPDVHRFRNDVTSHLANLKHLGYGAETTLPPSMSASPGIPRLQLATDANEGAKTSQRDVEQGDLYTEKQRLSPNLQGSSSSNDENPENEADEYIRLLKYIDLEAKKEKRQRDEGHDDGEDKELQRLWYMPWKKVPVPSTSTKGRKVPLSWLETDITQGLSPPEIEMRRARFGYNELERYVKQKRLAPL